MLTMISRNTAATSRRMMNAITAGGAAAPAGAAENIGVCLRSADREPAPSPAFLCQFLMTGAACLLFGTEHAVVVHPVVVLDEHVGQRRVAIAETWRRG